MTKLTDACPKCGAKELEYDPGESDQTAGPPDAWSQGCPAEVWCNACDWVPEDSDGWLQDHNIWENDRED